MRHFEFVKSNISDFEKTYIRIPAAIRALPGYGQSTLKSKNVVDIQNQTYTKIVNKLEITEDTVLAKNDSDTTQYRFYTRVKNAAVKIDIICNKLATSSGYFAPEESSVGIDASSGVIYINLGPYIGESTPQNAKKWLIDNGVVLYYPVDAEVMDISDHLAGFDPYIEVEAGGTITAEQADTKLPVQSEIVYAIKTGAENV